MKSFKKCGVEYASNTSAQTTWAWPGKTIGFESAPNSTISLAGCRAFCGTGMAVLPWEDVSNTITTWILPVIGTLLQAPFESNATRRTFLAIARWVGSPIASLSYVLWNIKVSAKAALMVDMAVPYDQTPACKTDFGSMRDSMYLLLAMNQYTIRPLASKGKEAEGLLRIVLFSRDLKLTDTDIPLRKMRRILAGELREMRRRGVVPVFISTLWFLFAFALSIQAALGRLGENATAHNLALGCLLAWFPILILGSIVDRNPIAAETIRKKLNTLVDHVRHSLRDASHREAFITSFRDQPNHEELRIWIQNVAQQGEHMEDFFVEFAGQARVRWHYGAAHAILCDIENCYIAQRGRNWLANEEEARASLVLGEVNAQGLMWFDMREFWQVASAVVIVLGSCGAAFIIAFFTPTVGLGCRSGGYMVFFVISLGLLIVEMTVWLATSPLQIEPRGVVGRTWSYVSAINPLEKDARWSRLKRQASSWFISTENMFIRVVAAITLLYPWDDKRTVRGKVKDYLDELTQRNRKMSTTRRWEMFFFRPVEAINTIWLVYIVLAQTIGWYKTCACVTSTWGGSGGYMDFRMQGKVESNWSEWFWILGTVTTSLVMALSMFYITVEWCQQSFLSTESYADAMKGLRRTRTYRHWTYYARRLSRALIKLTIEPVERAAVSANLLKKQETLLWRRKHTWNPNLNAPKPATHNTALPADIVSPSIELTDYSTTLDGPTPQEQDTPAMPHSLFPPAISVRRARAEEFTFTPLHSTSPSPFQSDRHPYRDSEDSYSPLVPRPVEAHHAGSQRSDSLSDEERRSSEALMEVQSEEGGLEIGMGGSRVVGRQRYRRAGSDAAVGIIDAVDLEKGVSR